jgi:glucosamine-6-phosphate deaminase
MRLVICKNKKQGARDSVDEVVSLIKKKRNAALGLATGRTMVLFYKELVRRFKKGEIDFSKVRVFNLDEYYPVSYGKSMRRFMDKHFFSKVNVKEKNISFLPYDGKNWKSACLEYEKKIRKEKIDLQILGIGVNGHIGFNEPGSEKKSRTRKVKLSKETIKQNKLKGIDFALTVGVSTILSSRKVVLLAFGKSKADAVKSALQHKESSRAPASFLRKHRDAWFIVDKSVASKL